MNNYDRCPRGKVICNEAMFNACDVECHHFSEHEYTTDCLNNLCRFWLNPVFCITIEEFLKKKKEINE